MGGRGGRRGVVLEGAAVYRSEKGVACIHRGIMHGGWLQGGRPEEETSAAGQAMKGWSRKLEKLWHGGQGGPRRGKSNRGEERGASWGGAAAQRERGAEGGGRG